MKRQEFKYRNKTYFITEDELIDIALLTALGENEAIEHILKGKDETI